MNRLLPLSLSLVLSLSLAACVDTTGLSADTSRPARGNANGVVIVAEFADLQCPACRAAHMTINNVLTEKYGAQVRFEFHHFPLQSLHRYALPLAEAAECAADQGKFWEFVDLTYEKQPELVKGSAVAWAEELKLDMDLFDRCTKSHIKRDLILAEYEEGTNLGVKGTPTYFVNGTQTPATVEGLSAAIDAALSGVGKKL